MKHETNEGVSNNAESQITKSEGTDSGIQQAALSSYDNGSFRSFVQESNQTSAAQSEKLANNNTIIMPNKVNTISTSIKVKPRALPIIMVY